MTSLNKELETLLKLIKKSARSPKHKEMLFGTYQHWAELGAIKNILLKKSIISRAELHKEMLPILEWMKRDFTPRRRSRNL